MTHYILAGARPMSGGLYVAFCEARCSDAEFSATPECPKCQQLLAEDNASRIALSQATSESFGGPPERHRDFDPTRDMPRRRKSDRR
jgi:hypothetical protein